MRRIDTAPNPSVSAMRIAAAAIDSLVNRGRRAMGSGLVQRSSTPRCSPARSNASARFADFAAIRSCFSAFSATFSATFSTTRSAFSTTRSPITSW